MKQIQVGLYADGRIFVRVKGADEDLMLMSTSQADEIARLIAEASERSKQGERP
jgi:hypothetical protein